MDIQKVVKYKLSKLGISRNKLAKLLSVSSPNLYKFLSGDRKYIGADKIIEMAEIVGLRNYAALFQTEHPKDLINFIDPQNKESSFEKSLLYLSILYDAQYYDYEDFKENVDSLSIMYADTLGVTRVLEPKEMIQFLSDILLYSNTLSSEIIREFINCRMGDTFKYKSFYEHKPAYNIDSLSLSLKDFNIKAKRPDYEEHDKSGIALGFEIPSEERLNIIEQIYKLRIDIYYYFINEQINREETILKLLDLEKIEDKIFKPRFGDLEYTFFQIFNGEGDSINLDKTNTISNQYRNINLFSEFDAKGLEHSYAYHRDIYQYYGKETKNLIVGLRINDESLNKTFAPGSYAIVELGKEVFNGDYAMVSINNQHAIIKKIKYIKDKNLIELDSDNEAVFPKITLPKNEVTILGKVIQGVTLI